MQAMSISSLEALEQAQFAPHQARAIARAIEADFTRRLDNLATRADIAPLATKAEIAQLATRAEIAQLATKAEVAQLATKAEIAQLATKTEIAQLATKAEIAPLATKAEIAQLATKSEIAQLATKAEMSQLATKADLLEHKTEVQVALAHLQRDLEGRIARSNAEITRWVFVAFASSIPITTGIMYFLINAMLVK